MADKDEFNEWLVSKLESLSLDSEVYCEYVSGIMGDSDMDLNERAETVKNLIVSALEDDDPDQKVESLPEELVKQWESKQEADKAQEEAQALAKREELERKQEEDRRMAKENSEKLEAASKVEMSREERRERERLLNAYAYAENDFDEDGNITSKVISAGDDDLGAMVGANTNKQRVQEEAQVQRVKAKAAHEAQQKRNKEQQMREKEQKEKKKERTQKKEKRRGCG
mmetsp:Transcript_13327/g.20305  ORF Transcript_13327/g.20305 Transcript_13327/m.20305 type:complete len:227 (+) Transcript_13327:276-956(+)|eukprot:CAMPEP_0194576808 /NCGR_PEP_ID=MMETSP0292-20121207/11806_1 /TAXON_ID=39354 /ORGANISM="Heterosigma akashiwo, Strain CCMP2393" /LENGTH=226 /DNA_ID=CAMNT_0039428993 /DNA_START=406 /DNA_END=1086 /DNA_ORIENTATION=+